MATPKTLEDKLILMVQDPEMVDVAQQRIDKEKLPYIIERNSEGVLELRSAYTRGEQELQKFITLDHDTIKMKEEAAKASTTPFEVLVFGETGTGKEIIASSQIGGREGFLKAVNCAGFPRELIESELFGHMRGSFTGADNTKEGLMSAAKDGVLFMDEIGELPLDVQAKLLRALQSKKIRKIGSNKEEDINCKFAFATNRNLEQMVESKMFREDLYARISTLELDIKPLRDRKCDIRPIALSLPGGKEFLDKYEEDLMSGLLPIRLNVRSLQQYIIRYSVWGRVTKER